MEKEEIIVTLRRLEHLMDGYNYRVTFGIDVFENCSTIYESLKKIKETHKGSRPEETTLILFDKVDFWDEINYGLAYRGDSSSGLILSRKKQQELEIEQVKYKNFIAQFINDKTRIYSYPDEQGIPGYPVFWDYTFLLLTDNNRCLFIYASSSD